MDRTRNIGNTFSNISFNNLNTDKMKKSKIIFMTFLLVLLFSACGGGIKKDNSIQYNPHDYAGTYFGKGNSIVSANFNADDMTVYVCVRTQAMTTAGYTSSWYITSRGMIFQSEKTGIKIIREFDGTTKLLDSSGDEYSFGTLNKNN